MSNTVSAIYSLCGWEVRVSLSDPRGHQSASWSEYKIKRLSHHTQVVTMIEGHVVRERRDRSWGVNRC